MNQYGGRIWAENEKNQSALFILGLPGASIFEAYNRT